MYESKAPPTADADAPEAPDRLPRSLAARAGAALGQDFSNVKVHQDGEADRLGTRAFARGNDLHFAAGAYQPTTPEGVALIGHELTHVAQQRDGRVAPSGTANGVAINADPAFESEANAKGASVAQGFELGGFLDFGMPGNDRAVAAPVVQGSDLAPDTEPSTAEPAPLTLADVMGDDYEAGRDEDENSYWDAYNEIEPLLANITGQNPGEAVRIGAELDAGDALIGQIRAGEAAVVASARTENGEVIRDEKAVAALLANLDRLGRYSELFLDEARLWELVLGVPLVEGLAALAALWVKTLERFRSVGDAMWAEYTLINKTLQKYQEEFEEACLKVGVDAASVLADLAVLGLELAPIPGAIAGLAIAGAGLYAGAKIEPGEGMGPLNYFNTVVGAGDLFRNAGQWWTGNKGFLVGAVWAERLNPLAAAVDLVSTGKDALEGGQYEVMILELQAELRDWETRTRAMREILPEVTVCMNAALPYLQQLEAMLNAALPAIASASAAVDQARASLR